MSPAPVAARPHALAGAAAAGGDLARRQRHRPLPGLELHRPGARPRPARQRLRDRRERRHARRRAGAEPVAARGRQRPVRSGRKGILRRLRGRRAQVCAGNPELETSPAAGGSPRVLQRQLSRRDPAPGDLAQPTGRRRSRSSSARRRRAGPALLRGLLVRSVAPQVGAAASARRLPAPSDPPRAAAARAAAARARPARLERPRRRSRCGRSRTTSSACATLSMRCSRGSSAASRRSASSPATWRTTCARRWPASARSPNTAWRAATRRSGSSSCASIVASEERASRLVEQLLALALADEARDSVKLEVLRVDELVRRVVLGFVPRADAAGVDLGATGLDTPARPGLGRPAGRRARQPDRQRPALRPQRPGGDADGRGDARATSRVAIAVIDDGPGLDAGQRERPPRRWERGATGVEAGAGAGLGLAIAWRYAELLGGELRLEPGPGERGLRAIVTLRAAAEPGTPAEPPIPSREHA